MVIVNGTFQPSLPFDVPSGESWFTSGFFETIRLIRGKIPFMNRHYARIISTASYLRFSLINFPSEARLIETILELAKLNKAFYNGKINLYFYTIQKESLQPKNREAQWVITALAFHQEGFGYHLDSGISAVIYLENKKPSGAIGSIKSNERNLYKMAENEATYKKNDDAIVLNTEGNAIETITKNLFLRKGTNVVTPNDNSGCIHGVMRDVCSAWLKKSNLSFSFGNLRIEDLENADEIMLTNALRGTTWINNLGRGENSLTKQFSSYLNTLATID